MGILNFQDYGGRLNRNFVFFSGRVANRKLCPPLPPKKKEKKKLIMPLELTENQLLLLWAFQYLCNSRPDFQVRDGYSHKIGNLY